MVTQTTWKLNNGNSFPAVGLGSWQGTFNIEDDKALENSILHALDVGYRLIDTAQMYATEHIVGRAIRNSTVPREDITVVTKFLGEWHHDPAQALEISLKELGLDYVDVFLMHWPCASTTAPEKKHLGKNESPTFIETWKKMEKLVGPKCRTIGVSNFSQKTLDELIAATTIVPAINQIELHALNPNLKLVPYCQEKGIVVMSWSTLGSGGTKAQEIILGDKLFADIAKAHNVSPGVVSLSWCVQRGVTVIPKSASHKRIEENINLVKLTDQEIDAINNAQDTLGRQRIAEGISFWRTDAETGGKPSLQKWTWEDYGWEDAEGNWLV